MTDSNAFSVDGSCYGIDRPRKMNLEAFAFSIINSICGRLFGIQLRAHRLGGNEPTRNDALRRLQGHQIEVASLIDIGASNGIWSKAFARYFPAREHLLVDANQIHLPKLTEVCRNNPKWHFAITAVGAKAGQLYFDASDPLVGHLAESPLNPNYRPCPVNTIDSLVESQSLPGPFMIKLDTHGVEIPILSGASKTLRQTNVIVIEAYNFTFGGPAVPFWDLCRYMLDLGFRPLDVFDILYREVDNAFWQFDLLFVRSDLPLFQDQRYFIVGRH
jgi:FkbM family methyltransferase